MRFDFLNDLVQLNITSILFLDNLFQNILIIYGKQIHLPFKNSEGSGVQYMSISSKAPELVLDTVGFNGHLEYSSTTTLSTPRYWQVLMIAPKF